MLGFWKVKTPFLPLIHNSLQDIQPMSAQNLFEDISSCTWPSPHIVSCLSLTSSVHWMRSDSPCWCASVDSHVSLYFCADRCFFFGSFWQLLKPYFTLHLHRNCCDVLRMDLWFSFKRSTDRFFRAPSRELMRLVTFCRWWNELIAACFFSLCRNLPPSCFLLSHLLAAFWPQYVSF